MRFNTQGARAPVEIPLPEGGVMTLKPWASGALVAARAAFIEVLAAGGSRADADVAFTAGAAAWGAIRWSGVFEASDGTAADDATADVPLEISADLVVLMVTTEPAVFSAIDDLYVIPGLKREAEKNGSAPSHAGAGPAGATTEN